MFRCLAAVSPYAVMLLIAVAGAGGTAAASAQVKSGTGFFVSPDGFLVTSAHVVEGCRNLSVWGAGGEHGAYVVARAPRLDVALLWSDDRERGASAASPDEIGRAGDDVFTLGFATMPGNPLQPSLNEGALLGEGTAEDGNRVLLIGTTLHAGNSGGAVLTRDGLVLGMVIGRDEQHPGRAIALPIEPIEALLASYGIVMPQGLPTGEPRQLLGAISALVQCSPRRR
jgi:S1-C subfamily serine protease